MVSSTNNISYQIRYELYGAVGYLLWGSVHNSVSDAINNSVPNSIYNPVNKAFIDSIDYNVQQLVLAYTRENEW